MKILELNLKKGFVRVVPETLDDLWHLYNIICCGDEVCGYTSREIKPDDHYARDRRGERVNVFLCVKVEKVFWDRFLGRLRIHGTICQAPETVPKGAHHTLNVRLNSPITIAKDKWSKHHIERLEESSKSREKPIIIIVVDDEGYAIATTAQYGVDVKVEERMRLPGKLEAENRELVLKEHFRKALDSLRQLWIENRSPIAVIGVGFLKNDFVKFVENTYPEIAKSIVDVKSVNNSGVGGIYEALRSGVLAKTMRRLRIMEEINVVEELFKRLGRNERNVAYGLEAVNKAMEFGAVETLILTDALLREAKESERLLLEELMRNVEQMGGKFMIISAEHEAGAKLTSLGGIAALLRFPQPN